MPAPRASSMTFARVMPSRMPTSGGGVQTSPPHDREDVAARALGDAAVVRAQDRLVGAAAAPRLAQREHVVEVVARLHRRVDRARAVARDGDDRRPPRPSRTSRGWARPSGNAITTSAESSTDRGVEIQLARRRGSASPARASRGCRPPRPSRRWPPRSRRAAGRAGRSGCADRSSRSRWSRAANSRPYIGADGLVDAVAVEKPAVEHRDLGFLGRPNRAVDVDADGHGADAVHRKDHSISMGSGRFGYFARHGR